MLRRFFVMLGSTGLYFLAFLLGASLVLFWFYSNFQAPLKKGSEEKVLFEIDDKWKSDTKKISEELQNKELIRSWWSVFYLKKAKSEFKERPFVAGEFQLSPSLTPGQVLDVLLSGKRVEHEVLVTPGMTISDVAKQIAASGLATEAEANEALRDQSLMGKLGVPAYIPEGYISAGSYSFARPIAVKQLVFKLISQGKKGFDDKNPGWENRAVQLRFRPYEILTLASIIEKEAPVQEERAKVSSVYHNRLRIGMPLQSNKALAYALPEFAGEIGQEQIKTVNPYNTYLNTGVPPTPICSPSTESLNAALFPEDTDFLYMLQKSDGSHEFAATYKAFQALIQKAFNE